MFLKWQTLHNPTPFGPDAGLRFLADGGMQLGTMTVDQSVELQNVDAGGGIMITKKPKGQVVIKIPSQGRVRFKFRRGGWLVDSSKLKG